LQRYSIKLLPIFFTLVFLSSYSSFAQSISGTVTDEEGEPAIGASVYFDGTTIGTSTNAEGHFSINSKGVINSALVISYMGYEAVIISNPFEVTNHKVVLTPKPIAIREVYVVRNPFTREELMKVFKKEFLGSNKAGRRCIILNEEDVDIYYDYGTKRLEASSIKPLQIENSYLGYKVEFNLTDFYIKFNKSSLKQEFIHSSLFLGTSLFTEEQKVSKRQQRRRQNSFKGSQLNFFRDLALMSWGKDGFTLFSGSMPILPTTGFEVKDTLGMKLVKVLPDPRMPLITSSGGKVIKPKGRTFNLLYRNRQQSMVKFSTNQFFIDSNGNNSHPQLISFGGEMGKRRFGSLLPLDYGP
jgi:hypothetical protein